MTNVNIIFDDMYDDSDLIAIPDAIAQDIAQIAQAFLNWVPTAEGPDYWVMSDGRKCTTVETDGFIKWLNNTCCKNLEKAYVVKSHTSYDPTHRIIEF